MPTVLRSGKFRFFFFSNEGIEPAHIHVEANGNYAKFWLEPVRLAKSVGYNARELNEINRLVAGQKVVLKEKWDEYFRKKI
jgi:hypothetical protein